MTTLSLTGVAKSFGRVEVLRDVSLTVPAGTRTAVVGASGSGKSTLLRLIAGFERADSGSIGLGSTTLAAPGRFVAAHRRGIGYVAQDGALFPHLTVEQNVRFGLPRRRRDPGRVREVMELASLDPELAGRYPHQLSGGQQQRVALARALAPRPAVVLLDEPFSALDTGLREQTRQAVIDALEASGVTTVLVTHDHDEALSFGGQIAVIAAGRLVQSGAPAAVFDNPVSTDRRLPRRGDRAARGSGRRRRRRLRPRPGRRPARPHRRIGGRWPGAAAAGAARDRPRQRHPQRRRRGRPPAGVARRAATAHRRGGAGADPAAGAGARGLRLPRRHARLRHRHRRRGAVPGRVTARRVDCLNG
nr:ABC transporter ATP-binding protein [Jiangella sp. DSM 45060]